MARNGRERPPLIQLDGVSKIYTRSGSAIPVLRDVTLGIAQGEFVAVWGPSGSGKSTLLHILGLLDVEYEGTYRFDGKPLEARSLDAVAALRNREIGFVFQTFHLLPQLSIADNVALPALYALDRPADECRSHACARLEKMGLGHRLTHRPSELSAGERQRAAIARALVNEPRLVLADEPTGALDSRNALEVLQILASLNAQGVTVVIVTHDSEVAEIARRRIYVRDGVVRERPL